MKINNLKINGYGKIKNKELNLNNGINIIHGKNEAGKSTTLSFINNMFYGILKTKNGKVISDFDKYKPWKTEEFSGKINYTLDNGQSYEVYREFKKKNPIIYDKNLNDISNQYIIDKSNGINFLNEQIGIDRDIFENTVITYQDGIKLSKSSQNTIIQKISNLVSSGDENISFKKTLDKINKLQTDEVGTARTSQKPINIVNDKIEKLENEKSELENYKSLMNKASDDYTKLDDELKSENIKLELLKKYRKSLDEDKIDFAEIDVNKNLEAGYDSKIQELKDKIDDKAKLRIQREKKSFIKNYIFILLIFIIMIITIALRIFIALPITIGIIDVVLAFITIRSVLKFKKQKKDKLNELDELEKRINQEIEILNKNKEERKIEIEEKENKIQEKRKEENQKLEQEFLDFLNKDFIQNVFDMNSDEIFVAIENKEERINNLNLNLHTKETEKQVMNEKLDNLAKIEEELSTALEEKKELNSLNNSFNIAKECMEIAYEKIRNSLSPEFTNELCYLIDSISNGKYKNIKFSDTEGLTIEIDDGRYISAENLSIGTIDQMYLSLRLSSLKAISKENMPIILDEAFVYFDDERLKNILNFMNKNYKDKQIIIFTCSDREKNILDNLKLQYNLIELES